MVTDIKHKLRNSLSVTKLNATNIKTHSFCIISHCELWVVNVSFLFNLSFRNCNQNRAQLNWMKNRRNPFQNGDEWWFLICIKYSKSNCYFFYISFFCIQLKWIHSNPQFIKKNPAFNIQCFDEKLCIRPCLPTACLFRIIIILNSDQFHFQFNWNLIRRLLRSMFKKHEIELPVVEN